MKKLMLFAMAILLCGCSGNTKKEETKKTVYKDGTYTTTATGYGGEFQVETTIKNDKVVDIVVKEHNETKYDVDTISGATKTSQALKDAVKNAYEKAKNTTE